MQSVIENNLPFGPSLESTNWPKEWPELKIIDDSLKCGICYEYFKTAMVTPCAHSYCSICIRQFLSFKTACPSCFQEVYENNLRNNRVLDRVVELFSHIRDKLIKHLKIAAVHFNCNEKSTVSSTPQNSSSLPSETPKNSSKKLVSKATSSKGKLNFSFVSSPSPSTSTRKSEISKRLEDILGSPSTNEPTRSNDLDLILPVHEDDRELNIPTVPSMFLKEPQPNQFQTKVDVPLVSCPVCSVGIPERSINTHLDNCLENANKPIKSPVKKTLKRNPLPKMVWTLMAEKDLRKKLKDYGLNTQGDKRALIARIQRYIVLFNSECDSENPRSISDIIRQVEREEKLMPAAQTQQRLIVHKKADPKVIEEENKKYIQENKVSFKKLIEAMREREGRNIKPLRPTNRLSSDEEDHVKEEDVEENMSSISKNPIETVNLCDSRTSSPILDSWEPGDRPVANGLSSDYSDQDGKLSRHNSSEDIFLPQTSLNQATPERKRTPCDDVQGSSTKSDVQSDICDAEALFHSSPSRGPLSLCSIVMAHSESDSEESISILINQGSDDEFNEAIGPATENDTGNSQVVDPDFVLATEDQNQDEEDCSEEVVIPRRKSKRKLQNSVVKEIPSPRRTRRRLNK